MMQPLGDSIAHPQRQFLTINRAHAKIWLTFKRNSDHDLSTAVDVITSAIKTQYKVLDDRLGIPGQVFIALPDRPTIADFATLPFAQDDVARMAEINFAEFPKLKEWSERMFAIEGVSRAHERARSFGVSEESWLEV